MPQKRKQSTTKAKAPSRAPSRKKPPVLKSKEGRCNHKRPDGTYCMRYPCKVSPLFKNEDGSMSKRCHKHGAKQFGRHTRGVESIWMESIPAEFREAFEALVKDPKPHDLAKSIAVLEARFLQILSRMDESGKERAVLSKAIEQLEKDAKLGKASAMDKDEDIGKLWDRRIRELQRALEAQRSADALWLQAQATMRMHADLIVKHQRHLQDNEMLVKIDSVHHMMTMIREDIRELVSDPKERAAINERWYKRFMGEGVRSGNTGREAQA